MNTLAMLLKESWTLVEAQADDLANNFYARIFLADPDIRELFPIEMSGQRSRFLDALVHIISTIDDPERFNEFLRALGRDHHSRFHVTNRHYGVVGAALLDALRQYAADAWTIEYDQAWRDAYHTIATTMLSGVDADQGRPAYWHAEVVAHERRGRDIAVFTCRPVARMEFRAGQYVSVECPYHPRLWRSYSIANAPRWDGTLDFHVRVTDGGWVSAALVRRLRPGDMIRLGRPMGSMTLDRQSTRDIVGVAGGTGLAPIKAMVEELTRENRTRWVHLFVGSRDRDDLYDLRDLQVLAGRYPWLSVVPACSNDLTYSGERGTIDEVVARYGPWSDHDFFVCGSPRMVRATLGTLCRIGVPQGRVRYDALAPALG
jgi:NAD(P)H-flavin reductase/hemoglobin-like flavoprotein